MTETHTAPAETEEVDLAITGMTCASCSARIERKLGKLEGVEASVNLATEKAHVRFAAPHTIDEILGTVRATGYGAEIIAPRQPSRGGSTPHTAGPAGATSHDALDHNAMDHNTMDHDGVHDRAVDHLDHDVAPHSTLKRRALISAILTLPVVLLAMVPALGDVPGNAWWQFILTTPVVLWAAWPFHRAAAINARHRASTMDTLVSIGVLAAHPLVGRGRAHRSGHDRYGHGRTRGAPLLRDRRGRDHLPPPGSVAGGARQGAGQVRADHPARSRCQGCRRRTAQRRHRRGRGGAHPDRPARRRRAVRRPARREGRDRRRGPGRPGHDRRRPGHR